ncbi:hypothetical protein NE865_01908 [Phthorimaea operculella]|nr:hypothetical protein NE865_01908 [Phthorimaea operculella]
MSYFGEIAEPGSRAAFEDWDDAIEHSTVELKWQQDLESPDEIETFLVLEGKYLADCIKSQDSNLELINTIPAVNLKLYRSKVANQHICTILDYNLVLSSQIVELLRQYLIVSKNVIAIQTKPLAEHQASSPTVICTIRAVYTTQKQSLNIKQYPRLEQPNIITGVSAGVISLREHLDECGTAIVAYLENTEEYDIKEMHQLLEQLNIPQPSTRTTSILTSNLYM